MLKFLTLLSMLMLLPLSTFAADSMFEVTITNITKNINFTPIMVATTHHGFPIFTLGQPASENVAKVAEGGNTAPLKDFLLTGGHALDVHSSEGLLKPGQTTTVKVKYDAKYNHVTVISMLLPTNDAFFSIIEGNIAKHGTSIFWAKAYDSGTEMNDEDCANIPGPRCGGEGYNVADGEGFVHVHAGIHGTSNLAIEDYNWNNPVAKITVTRIK